MKLLLDATLEVLQQVKKLIDSCETEAYARPCEYSMSSVGQHIRHILDHFLVFQQGLDDGCINYNLRSRGNIVESNPQAALQKIAALREWFKDVDLQNRSIQVISEISVSQINDMNLHSNIQRELIYIINHTIHHIAYASLVANHLCQKVDVNLGIAPATATYLRSQTN